MKLHCEDETGGRKERAIWGFDCKRSAAPLSYMSPKHICVPSEEPFINWRCPSALAPATLMLKTGSCHRRAERHRGLPRNAFSSPTVSWHEPRSREPRLVVGDETVIPTRTCIGCGFAGLERVVDSQCVPLTVPGPRPRQQSFHSQGSYEV